MTSPGGGRARLAGAVPVVFVRDVEAAAHYYRDSLGFAVDFLYGEPPFYGSVSRGGASIHLKFVHEPVLHVGPEDREAFINAFVPVENVDALYAELRTRSVTFDQELVSEAWGGRDFIVRDPDGNTICFAETPFPVRGPTRVGAYGLLTRGRQVLLCRIGPRVADWAGFWTLPGGGIEHGEPPEEGMIREVEEETGLLVRADGIAGIDSLVAPDGGGDTHSLRILYFATVLGGTLRDEVDGSTDLCAWHDIDAVSSLPVVSLVRSGLDLLDPAGGPA